MNNPSRNLKVLIAEMSEDDLEFQGQLTNALYNGLKELKTQYVIGANSKDEEIIKQIRHKSKPTLQMFEFEEIILELSSGKEILESIGFSTSFHEHMASLVDKVDVAIQDVHALV